MSAEHLEEERLLAEQVVKLMPADEEELALKCGTTRNHIASVCTTLQRQHRIQLDRSWDAPRHWKAA